MEIDFSPLRSLTALKTLDIDLTIVADAGFWVAIKNKSSITRLICYFVRGMDAVMRDSIASLKELRALDFPDVVMHGRNEQSVSLAPQVTQLTALSISVKGSLASDIGCSTNLVRLELQVYPEFDCSLDDTVALMPHLQRLAVKRRGEFFCVDLVGDQLHKRLSISSNALLELKQLRSLSLESVAVNRFFFQELASVVKLTKLEFKSTEHETCVQSIVSQIHQLEHLEELELHLADQSCVCDWLSAQYLPRLSKLSVPSLTEEEEETRRTRFASRPQVLINSTKKSRWYSRSAT